MDKVNIDPKSAEQILREHPPSAQLQHGVSQKQLDLFASKVVNMEYKYQMANKRLDHYDGFEKRLKHIEGENEEIRRLFRLEKTVKDGAFDEVLDRMDICERAAGSTKKTYHKLERKFEVLDADLVEYKRTNGAKISENYKELKYWLK